MRTFRVEITDAEGAMLDAARGGVSAKNYVSTLLSAHLAVLAAKPETITGEDRAAIALYLTENPDIRADFTAAFPSGMTGDNEGAVLSWLTCIGFQKQ